MASFKDLKFLTIIFWGILTILGSDAIKYRNVTESELEQCMINKGNTLYELFFPVNKNSKKIAQDEIFHLNFYMMNETDGGVIFLAKEPSLLEEKEMYRIELRKRGDSGIWTFDPHFKWLVKIKSMPDIFSNVGPTQIKIVQKKDDTLLVYVPSYSAEPIVQYMDPYPKKINYFSLWSWSSSSKWFHFCPFDNLKDGEIPTCRNDICDCQNGFCATPGNCTCHAGFSPSNTTENKCDPICIDGCPNGFCYSPGKCACNTGYYMTSNNLCSPVCTFGCANGYCSAPQQCTCGDGYKWSDKNMQCEPVCKDGCENGYCKYPGICGCNEGFLWNANICQVV